MNILPSHFPISPLPLADLKGRRDERDMERKVCGGGREGLEWERRGRASTVGREYDKEIKSRGVKLSYLDASQLR